MKLDKRLIIIDGNSIINRAFYALPEMSNKDGLKTNAVYGFTTMLFKIIDTYNPTHISVAFDRKAPTFRHLEYKEYKDIVNDYKLKHDLLLHTLYFLHPSLLR